MMVVLDSNEYITYFNENKDFLDKLLNNKKIEVYINELLIKEVLRNIKETSKTEFYQILFRSNIILQKEKLPFHLLIKYKQLGLKKGDITIAAFCDSIDADFLITENRHFLKSRELGKFKILNSKELTRQYL